MVVTATDTLLSELQGDILLQHGERPNVVEHELQGSAFIIGAEEMAFLSIQLEKATQAEQWAEALKLYALLAKAFASAQEELQQDARMRFGT